MIPVFKPLITMNERKAADKSLEIGWLGMGQYVNEFEKKIKLILEYTGNPIIFFHCLKKLNQEIYP